MSTRLRAPRCSACALLSTGLLIVGAAGTANPAEVAGVKIQLHEHPGRAQVAVEATGKHELTINVDPAGETQPLTIGVELPNSGPYTWPAADVEVLDSHGRAVAARRSGIEWHKLFIPIPAARGSYVVHAAAPREARSRLPSEADRRVTDPATGLVAAIAKWHGGRRAALSIRFDDSHPTHLSKAIPTLRQYGFRGTFMVNPGTYPANSRRRSNYQDQRDEWEACARRGDQEFANHTAHHRGASDDEAMEREIVEASKAIWDLFPGKSKLLALNLGGGTQWTTTKTLRYYLDKYHLFDASSGSLGMDDVYGNRPAAFREHLRRHLERGAWCRIHFHAIGVHPGASEANFRAALDIAKEHESDLWIAGMADIHKYQTERNAASLAIQNETAGSATLKLSCLTDPQLYDQPLTLEVKLPPSWPAKEVRVKPVESGSAPARPVADGPDSIIRFDVPPITAAYAIQRMPPAN